jgi:hypothetical protein
MEISNSLIVRGLSDASPGSVLYTSLLKEPSLVVSAFEKGLIKNRDPYEILVDALFGKVQADVKSNLRRLAKIAPIPIPRSHSDLSLIGACFKHPKAEKYSRHDPFVCILEISTALYSLGLRPTIKDLLTAIASGHPLDWFVGKIPANNRTLLYTLWTLPDFKLKHNQKNDRVIRFLAQSLKLPLDQELVAKNFSALSKRGAVTFKTKASKNMFLSFIDQVGYKWTTSDLLNVFESDIAEKDVLVCWSSPAPFSSRCLSWTRGSSLPPTSASYAAFLESLSIFERWDTICSTLSLKLVCKRWRTTSS